MLDYGRFAEVLAEIGYEGWVVVEAEQDPAKAPPMEYAVKGLPHAQTRLQPEPASPSTNRGAGPAGHPPGEDMRRHGRHARSLQAVSPGKIAVVTGGTQGLGETCARCSPRAAPPASWSAAGTPRKGEAVARSISEAGTQTRFVRAEPDPGRGRAGRGPSGRPGVRPGRRAGQRRRADRPRHDLGHQPRALRPAVRRQCPGALLP